MISDPSKARVKLESPSAERNRDPIWQVLDEKVVSPMFLRQQQKQQPLKILEIAAGAGVHTHYFAKQFLIKYKELKLQATTKDPPFVWYPTDTDPMCLSSIQAYIDDDSELFTSNVVQTPKILTLNDDGITETTENDLKLLDLIMNINMIHISPWSATIGLMKVAGQRLRNKTGILFLYGPYKVNGTYCESNQYVFFLDEFHVFPSVHTSHIFLMSLWLYHYDMNYHVYQTFRCIATSTKCRLGDT